MPQAASTSPYRLALALCVALASVLAAPASAQAAASLTVDVTPPQPATGPAEIAIAVQLSASAPGGLPPALRALAISMPAGFEIALAGTTSCSQDELELRGPTACPAASKLGSGGASFVYVAGALRFRASTSELSVFRGAGDAVLAYVRVTEPTTFSVVLPGTLAAAPAGPQLRLDLARIARIEGGGSAVVTRIAVVLARGLRPGPCPWTFAGRLDFVGGGAEEPTATARCETGPAAAAPVLRAAASDGPAAAGARVRARLSQAATVRVTLERRTRTRWTRVLRASFEASAGASVLRIGGPGGRTLAPGRYRARLRAAGAGGLLSAKRTVAFRLR